MPRSSASLHGGVQVAGVHPTSASFQKNRCVEPRNSDPRAFDRKISGELSPAWCSQRRPGGVGEIGSAGGVDGGGFRQRYDEGDEERRRGNGTVAADRNELQRSG